MGFQAPLLVCVLCSMHYCHCRTPRTHLNHHQHRVAWFKVASEGFSQLEGLGPVGIRHILKQRHLDSTMPDAQCPTTVKLFHMRSTSIVCPTVQQHGSCGLTDISACPRPYRVLCVGRGDGVEFEVLPEPHLVGLQVDILHLEARGVVALFPAWASARSGSVNIQLIMWPSSGAYGIDRVRTRRSLQNKHDSNSIATSQCFTNARCAMGRNTSGADSARQRNWAPAHWSCWSAAA